jgi:Na+:H+ antiporter
VLLVGAVLLARLVMVVLITAARSDLWPWSWRIGLIWAGMRGALSLALALSVPPAVASHEEILLLVFGFTFFSLAFQGLSTAPLFGLLGITRHTAVKTVR